MLDPAFAQHVQNLLDAERATRNLQVEEALSRTLNDAAAHGMGRSSRTVLQQKKVIADELASRGNLILVTIQRVHAALGGHRSETLAQDLKQEASRQITVDANALGERLENAVRHQTPDIIKRVKQLLDEDIMTVVRKLEAELNLYAAALNARAIVPSMSGANTVNITASMIGAVQTATGAIANVIQNIQSNDQQKLVQALEKVLHDVSSSSDILPDARREIEVMAQEAKTELSGGKPVLAKVRGMLIGIGGTIQTLGSMRGAYELLKAAGAAIGVYLP